MDNGAWGGTLKDKDTITIATFGWSPGQSTYPFVN